MIKHQVKFLFLIIVLILISIVLITYGEAGLTIDPTILWQLRIPKIIIALLAGGLLATSGLLMQIFFQNPMAGPEILGISSGSSLFVAFWMMSSASLSGFLYEAGASIFSLLGSLVVFGILLFFIHKNINKFSLLIIGLLISTFTSSCISFLINLSSNIQIKNYLTWSMGSFRNVTIEEVPYFLFLSAISISTLFLIPNQLNQFQLGENYAQSLGVDVRRLKVILISSCALSISTVTLFCGPIGFIGIMAPHLARIYLKTSTIKYILMASFLIGGLIAVLSELLLVLLPSLSLSINTVLGFFGAPFVMYYLYRQNQVRSVNYE